MHNFQYFGAIGSWGDHFSTKPPNGTSSADFTRFESLCVRICSGFISCRRDHEKSDTTKCHTEVTFHLFAGNSHSTKFNQNWHL